MMEFTQSASMFNNAMRFSSKKKKHLININSLSAYQPSKSEYKLHLSISEGLKNEKVIFESIYHFTNYYNWKAFQVFQRH